MMAVTTERGSENKKCDPLKIFLMLFKANFFSFKSIPNYLAFEFFTFCEINQ